MDIIAKETDYKKLTLSSKKLKDISISPKVKDGKVLFDKKNSSHRYIMGEDD